MKEGTRRQGTRTSSKEEKSQRQGHHVQSCRSSTAQAVHSLDVTDEDLYVKAFCRALPSLCKGTLWAGGGPASNGPRDEG